MAQRQFSAYEINQLRRWQKKPDPQTAGSKPVEYLTGHAEFCGLDFLVTPDTLIPRLESEKIIDLALDFISNRQLPHPQIADIGTGSGCLGITLAYRLSKQNTPYTIFLSDISLPALKVADLNVQRLLYSPENIFFQPSNLFQAYPPLKFDLILANLPYIPSSNIPLLDASVKDHEPIIALDGGSKGNLFINALLDQLPVFLAQQGQAIIEIDDTHTLDSFSLPPRMTAQIITDCFDKPRFLVCSYL